MKIIIKIFSTYLLIVISILNQGSAHAWGPKGHAIVGELAIHFLKNDVRENVLKVLGDMPVDTAANWMDIMKSNQDYDFMRPWHYIDFPKEQSYQVSNDENIINRLAITYNELKHKNTLCTEQIKTDVLILFHLMGDLHTPLHTAYPDDLGGNKVMIQYDTMKSHNLHRFWDEDIISLENITFKDCINFYDSTVGVANKLDTIGKIDFVRWMLENRKLLPAVYDYNGFTITEQYLQESKSVVKRQLVLAGLRLAFILNSLFQNSAPNIETDKAVSTFKNGIDAKDALQNVGKKVTVCSKVYGMRFTPQITQINLGDKYPNSPLTVIIFPSNYSKFKTSLDDLFRDKNICVKGKIELYKGKAQIIVEEPDNIMLISH